MKYTQNGPHLKIYNQCTLKGRMLSNHVLDPDSAASALLYPRAGGRITVYEH